MSSTGKAGLTVSLVFIVPLVLVVCMLFAARDDRPNAAVVPRPESRIVQLAPVATSEYQRQKDEGIQRMAQANADRRAEEDLNNRIHAAVDAAMDAEKSGY